MGRGRVPKPTKIQVDLRGDPSKRRKNCVEPEAPDSMPNMPERFEDNDIARHEWHSTCHHLHDMGILSRVDRAMLELYVDCYVRYREAEANVRKYGDVLLKNGNPEPSPHFKTMNRYAESLRKYLIEFGLSPAARARMRVTIDNETETKWTQILGMTG